ncbi:MAG: hypothetical protein ACYTG7_23575 [Planctomycetota bacterium]|jgi:hypothetical protein
MTGEHPSMQEPLKSNVRTSLRKFLLLSVMVWILPLAILGLYAAFGDGAVERAFLEEEPGLFDPLLLRKPGETQAQVKERADGLMRAFLVIVASLYAFLALAFLLTRRGMKKRYSLLLIPFCWLSIEQWAAPGLADHLKLNKFYLVQDPDHRPKETDPKTGWNSDSIRCSWESAQFEEEGLNLIFLGDSFTFGFRLPPRLTFPHKVQRGLADRFPGIDIKAATFGWVSSSPLLSLRRLKDLGHEYKPDFVLLCIDMTDFHDDIVWTHMLRRKGIFFVYDKIPLLLRLAEALTPAFYKELHTWFNEGLPASSTFMFQKPLEENRHFLKPITQNIEKIHEYTESLGARFIVVVLPRSYHYNPEESPESWERILLDDVEDAYLFEPFHYFDELREKVDFPICSLLEGFQKTEVFPTCFQDDPHWNDNGTTVAAGLIVDHILEQIEARLGIKAQAR